MSRQPSRLQESQRSDRIHHDKDQTLPLLTKIEQIHIRNLENIITMLCQLINDMIKVIDYHDIRKNQDQLEFTSQQLTPKTIVSIKEANNQIKYHQKISPIQREQATANITADIEYTLQLLAKLKIKEVENSLPKVKRYDESGQPPSFFGQLSTIAQKQSQQNLHNYLKTNLGGKRRSKSNISKVYILQQKNNFLFNTSSIEDIQFQVIREETRKSLDNPYHKNNQTRKGLYNDLEKMKGQDSLLPAVKSYLDKHRKNNSTTKSPQYVIQKLI